jgi:predicted alpha/beta-hydrolase family hydrolase
MKTGLVRYSFSESNKKTLVFLPGYSGGLEVSIIKYLIEYYVMQGSYNVFGLTVPYQEDTPDLFDSSQTAIISLLQQVRVEAQDSDITLLAKSLGGSIALSNSEALPVDKLVVLGCSVVLGWPQRVSILKMQCPVIPDYKLEWGDVLQGITKPTLIINGGKDNLTDNKFLSEKANQNENIKLIVLDNADHNLESINTKESSFNECVHLMNTFLI